MADWSVTGRRLQTDDIPIRLARVSTQRMHCEACRMGGARSPQHLQADGSDGEVSLRTGSYGLRKRFSGLGENHVLRVLQAH